MKFNVDDKVKYVRVVLDAEDYDIEDADILPVVGDTGTVQKVFEKSSEHQVFVDRLGDWFIFLPEELELISE